VTGRHLLIQPFRAIASLPQLVTRNGQPTSTHANAQPAKPGYRNPHPDVRFSPELIDEKNFAFWELHRPVVPL
jgi:hypothetical protein